MWIATWALNTLVAKGKATDWMVHMIGQSVGGLHRRHPRHDPVGGLPCPTTGTFCPTASTSSKSSL